MKDFGAAFRVLLIFLFLLPSFARADEYRVGEGDLLRITVYEHPDLETEARVSGDGVITFSLIGMVRVEGLSASEVEKLVVRLLEDGYIKNAQVTVFIKEYRSKRVTVVGEFVKPGIVELPGARTLLEAISSAGGITPNAGDMLYIQRKIFGGGAEEKDVTVTVDLKKLLEEGDVTANVAVQDGDSIYVPRAAFVYVSGEVKSPNAYKITKGLTVLKAITLAGGFTEMAWKGRTKIIRKGKDGREATVPANMDDLVMPDDVILVPESIF
ncbi:MAG: SLBB domain-containing protein [Deltaproteobacteria bacterium]|nr:SLBB domain-containing protein [Deltaproteobacteria bacterium]